MSLDPAIETLREEGDVEGLLEALRDDEDDVFRPNRAVDALGELRDPRAIEPLLAALQLSDVWGTWAQRRGGLSENIIAALGKIGGLRVAKGLTDRLAQLTSEGSSVWERQDVLRALGDIAGPDTRPALVSALPTLELVVGDPTFFDLDVRTDDPWLEEVWESREPAAWAAAKKVLLCIGEPAVAVVRDAFERQRLGARRRG